MKESLTLKIYKDLFDKIKSNFYKPSQKLPTETELTKIYNVSKAPIRQALAKLNNDGLIIRQAGKGTFVSSEIKKDKMTFLGGFGAYFTKYEKNIICKMIELKEVYPKTVVKERLKMQDGEKVVLISRIRFVNNKPVFLLNHYVTQLPINTFKNHGSIKNMRKFLQEQNVKMEHIKEEIQAVVADKYLSNCFNIDLNTPLLKINRTTYDISFHPVVYEEYYVLSEEWRYEVQFKV